MKFKSYSDHKNKQKLVAEAAAMRVNENYIEAVKGLTAEMDNVKKVIKNSAITALEVWVEVAVKTGILTEDQAQKVLATKTNESSDKPFKTIEVPEDRKYEFFKTPSGRIEYRVQEWDSVAGEWDRGLIQTDLNWLFGEENPEIDAFLAKEGIKKGATNEAEGDDLDGQISDEEMNAFNKEIEKALKIVIQDIPADVKAIADGGEIELAPNIDKAADKELNEAIGALIAGGALALPAITQIFGKTVAWAGEKMGSKDIESFGKAAEKLGHDLHHKYEHVLDKMLSPFTKSLSDEKRKIVNKVVFYSIIAVLGGAGIAGAVKAAGAGQAGIAAVEGGLSGVKASELAQVAKDIIPRVLGKMVEAA